MPLPDSRYTTTLYQVIYRKPAQKALLRLPTGVRDEFRRGFPPAGGESGAARSGGQTFAGA